MVALLALVEILRSGPQPEATLLDVQWRTDHLATLGVREIHRREYLRRHGECDSSSKDLKDHSPERLNALHTEYELEASALLALR